jgi:hypothetical protein
VSPNITATGTLNAHIIPSLNFGLSAFAGKASATIDLAIDTSATIALSIGAGASLTQTAASGSASDVQSCISSCAALMAPMPARRAAAAGGVQGCVDAKVGIAATAGAQGTLFDLLDDSTTLPLFAKEFELLSKCFGTQTSTKRAEIAPAPERAPALARRALQLQCPKVKAADAEPLVQGTVAAAQYVDFGVLRWQSLMIPCAGFKLSEPFTTSQKTIKRTYTRVMWRSCTTNTEHDSTV